MNDKPRNEIEGGGESTQGLSNKPRIAVVDLNGNYLNDIANSWANARDQFDCELVPITFGQSPDFKPYRGNDQSPAVLNLPSLEDVKRYLLDPATKIDGVLTGRRVGKKEYAKELLGHLAMERFEGFTAVQHASEMSVSGTDDTHIYGPSVIGQFDKDEIFNSSETKGGYQSGLAALIAKIKGRGREK